VEKNPSNSSKALVHSKYFALLWVNLPSCSTKYTLQQPWLQVVRKLGRRTGVILIWRKSRWSSKKLVQAPDHRRFSSATIMRKSRPKRRGLSESCNEPSPTRKTLEIYEKNDAEDQRTEAIYEINQLRDYAENNRIRRTVGKYTHPTLKN